MAAHAAIQDPLPRQSNKLVWLAAERQACGDNTAATTSSCPAATRYHVSGQSAPWSWPTSPPSWHLGVWPACTSGAASSWVSRGFGKSVLVTRIADLAAAEGHLVLPAVRLAAGDDGMVRTLAVVQGALRALDGSAGVPTDLEDLLDRVSEVLIPVVGGGVKLAPRHAERGSPHVLLTEALTRLAEHAADSSPRRLVLLRVDEVQHLAGHGLSRFLTALGDALNGTVAREDPARRAARRPPAHRGLPVRPARVRAAIVRRLIRGVAGRVRFRSPGLEELLRDEG